MTSEHSSNGRDCTTGVEYRVTHLSTDILVGDDGSHWRRIIPKQRPDRYINVSVRARRGEPELQATLHVLVLTAFKGPCPSGAWGLHKDDNPHNNRLSNLYWGTPTQNALDRACSGKTACGSRHFRAKLKDADIPEIRRLGKAGMSFTVIGKMYGVTHGVIWGIVRGTAWKHVPDNLDER